jgi:PDDEXK-like uncharacterized protein DUF3799
MLMTDLSNECPSPGIYEGVSFDEYNAWRALSNSGLSLLAKSPRHFNEGERCEQTPDMAIGNLCHAGVFEPASVAERYAIQPPYEFDPENVTDKGAPSTNPNTNYCKRKRAEFEAANVGKEIVERKTYEQMMTLVLELAANETANRLLNAPGPCEVSIVWDEQVAGFEPIRCKARFDKISLSEDAFVDLKKCTNVAEFEKDIAKRSYHRQMSLYQRGWAALHDGELLQPYLIAHEMAVPLSVIAAPLSDVAIIEGGNQVDRLLNLYVQCRAADAWPGVPNPIVFDLPAWALSEPEPLVASDGRETY